MSLSQIADILGIVSLTLLAISIAGRFIERRKGQYA